MDFRTIFQVKPLPFRISHQSEILTSGSCFATSMGDRLTRGKFPCLTSPFGTVYNPVSIHEQVSYAFSSVRPREDRIMMRDGRYVHLDYHSSLSGSTPQKCLDRLIQQQELVKTTLTQTKVIMLTYGTAWVHAYQHQVVANCHKQPASWFEKRLLTLTEIKESFQQLKNTIDPSHQGIQFLLSVSPVRHLKDGFEENAVSKALLRLACYELQEHDPNVHYFPAYEVLLDDLRDYRFYADDMLHPSPLAEEYIWQQFVQSTMDTDTRHLLQEIESIMNALTHRPFQSESVAHQQFLHQLKLRLQKLNRQLPMTEELAQVENSLTSPPPV
jgi:hypothetical protein